MNFRIIVIVALVLVTGIGGKMAYESYQAHERAKVWDSVLSEDDCNTCAARKKSMMRSKNDLQEKKKNLLSDLANEEILDSTTQSTAQ